MNPCFAPDWYHDEAIFRREQKLFEGLWAFAGVKQHLAQPDDYISAQIGRKSVFVQNFDGELRAYENVCSHRFARLRPKTRGHGPVQCPYHAWTYNRDGIPDVIPKKPRFDHLTPERRRALGLAPWQVAVCGSLIFVKAAATGPSLAEFLGDAYAPLAAMTSAFGPLLDENTMDIAANWKIVVENTLEGYHVAHVHAETFERLKFRSIELKTEGLHTAWLAELGEEFTQKSARVNQVFQHRPFQISGYRHWLVFPNLTLATTFGTSFAIQTIAPLSPGLTRFTSYVFGTQLKEELKGVSQTISQALYDGVVAFNRKVFLEDKAVVEFVHLGAAQTRGPGILSDDELRVFRFQTDYVRLLNELAPA